MIGLGLFLVAHLLYIFAFATKFRLHRSGIPAAALILLYAAILAWTLRPNLGEMVIPVFVYLIVATGICDHHHLLPCAARDHAFVSGGH